MRNLASMSQEIPRQMIDGALSIFGLIKERHCVIVRHMKKHNFKAVINRRSYRIQGGCS